jgi:short subunit dehydrogenase-like uncharacterized protein
VTGRIVLFGATGYTGRLTAEAMVVRGERPVLAGRNSERLAGLAGRLGGLETEVADAARPETIRELVEPGDVLVTTVGPFARLGDAAVEAAIDARAAYLDSNGEPSFIRRVFERYGQRAADSGAGLVTAFGYDSVPGNLAATVALRESGEAAARVDIGYFMPGDRRGWMSGGTQASLAGASLEPAFVWRAGIRTERPAARVRSFELEGRRHRAISAGSSEHFALPRLHPHLREVNTYLGYLVRTPRTVQVLSAVGAGAGRVPGVRALAQALARRFARGSTNGPDEKTRAKTGSHIVAITYDATGAELTEVHLSGINGYEFTGRILAWGASRAAAGSLTGAGALGPVDVFGLAELEAGCTEAGMECTETLSDRGAPVVRA